MFVFLVFCLQAAQYPPDIPTNNITNITRRACYYINGVYTCTPPPPPTNQQAPVQATPSGAVIGAVIGAICGGVLLVVVIIVVAVCIAKR